MSTPRRRSRQAFTLLEVLIALGILTLSLFVLIQTQSLAALMTGESQRMETATQLADEKMKEVLLTLEREGWSSQDVEEEGDFEEFGAEEFRGDGLSLEMGEQLADYQYAYTVREIELDLPTNLGEVAGQLGDNGYGSFGTAADEGVDYTSGMPDLGGFIQPEMITDYLSAYVREVRVRVWWGENEDELDQVELVHHVINPSGAVNPADTNQPQGGGGGAK